MKRCSWLTKRDGVQRSEQLNHATAGHGGLETYGPTALAIKISRVKAGGPDLVYHTLEQSSITFLTIIL